MTYQYPDGDLHNPRVLLGLLGSFWSEQYAGRDQLRVYGAATGEVAAQAHIDLREAVDSVARQTVPVHHTEEWTLCYLRQSERGKAPARYGAAGVFGEGLLYGGDAHDDRPTWPCPVNSVDVLANRISHPSAVLIRGVDFTIEDGRFVFRDDPFADSLLASRAVVDEMGVEVDRELALWLFRARTDREHIWTHFGYVLNLKLSSSAGYRDLVNALLDAIVGGTAMQQVCDLLAAVTDCRLAGGDEVVESVLRERGELLVITDRDAYRYPAGASAVVAPGDRVSRADPLADTILFHDLNRGDVPAWLPALALGPGLTLPRFLSDITFENRNVPLWVSADATGRTRVSWSLGGFPADVIEFWDEVHRRGVAGGLTLAQLLDLRESPVGEPRAIHLPSQINPLHFLVANFLRYNTLLVRVRADGMGPNALGLEHLRLLRRILPPQTCILTVIEVPIAGDSATVDLVAEDLGSYSGTDPLNELVDVTMADDGPPRPSAWTVSCQSEGP
jgi:hypothetical protein